MRKITPLILVLCFWVLSHGIAQKSNLTEPKPYGALPSQRQLLWQETEMYALIHFTPTTFENKEWGYGDADPSIFNPRNFDAEQIVMAAKNGGLKGLIFVAKHHDGFCLWPTKTTPYNISKSPWRNGKGDMVKEMEQACRKNGLKFGIYCSPWDRNNPEYGTAKYLEIYRAQLKELYSNYGKLFMSWHDGANGGDGYYGGKREKRKIDNLTYYDWTNTWNLLTRKLQPKASIFSDIGWDVRWVGNEEGHAGETSWATFTPVGLDGGKLAAPGSVETETSHLGTRNGKYWIPAECDVSLRKGWFYHPEQDATVKTPDQLLDLYYASVGRGACLDLGLSPNLDGQIHSLDCNSLMAFNSIIKTTFENNLIHGAKISASNIRGASIKFDTKNLIDNDRYSFWATDDKINEAEVLVDLGTQKSFNVLRIRENIKLGQRIDSCKIAYFDGTVWIPLAEATSIGANKLIRLPKSVTAEKLRFSFIAPVSLCVSDLGIFQEP
jgi:alpha-L-fucosidase